MAAGSGEREITMTGLVQSARATEDSALSEVGAPLAPATPVSPAPSQQGWHTIGWFACGVAGFLAIAWFIFFGRGELGSKADWFFGAVVFCLVLVTMWQTLTVQRQANQHAAAAAERLRTELGLEGMTSLEDGLSAIIDWHREELRPAPQTADAGGPR